ncbi:ricin-type beta-trefoil lectin domain protein [Myxococcus sp. 1LA]
MSTPADGIAQTEQGIVWWTQPAVGIGGKCLDVAGGAFANGTPVLLWDCHGGPNQKWLLADNGTLMGDHFKCATVKDNNPAAGTPIVMSDCIDGKASQQWKRTSLGQLQGFGGRCISATGGNTANGTSIILWDCLNVADQKWNVEVEERGSPPQDFCWRMRYDRGAGSPPDRCPSGQERSGAVCYPTCAPGYVGVADRCYQQCQSGYTDDGTTCRRPGQVISADNSRCPGHDLCGLTLAKGCTVCPSGFVNDGCTCRRDPHVYVKQNYYRGAGSALQCASWLDSDGGACYPHGASNYDCAGTVCHGPCPSNLPSQCGATCAASQDVCNKTVAAMVVAGILTVGAASIPDGVDAARAVFSRPTCLLP